MISNDSGVGTRRYTVTNTIGETQGSITIYNIYQKIKLKSCIQYKYISADYAIIRSYS
jgi:hypothetical protein